jgi:hypothetical protein
MLTYTNYPQRAAAEDLWGAETAHEHSVQIYADEGALLYGLDGFVSGGLRAGDGVIVIATAAHRLALEERLRARGFNLDLARAEDRYVPVDAEAALARFMTRGWPDEERFALLVNDLVRSARGSGRRVRAFGEMVALLWRQGQASATVRLEALWNEYLEQETFCLFCAYAETDFPEDAQTSLAHICSQHMRQIALSS